MFDWIEAHQVVALWLVAGSVATFLGTLIVVPILVIRIPPDYFLRDRPRDAGWRGRHPVVGWTILSLKNLAGATFVSMGLLMLVTPGQGVLTILVGVTLLDFPGKRALELWIVRQPAVLRVIDWMRAKAHRAPLQLP